MNIKKTLNKRVRDNNKRVQDSGYARVANIMRGLVPSVETFGIITAWNPYDPSMKDGWDNDSSNKELEKILRDGGYGFQKVIGDYEGIEESFFVPNISREFLIKLGKNFGQETVVFGKKATRERDGEQYTGMEIELIWTYNEDPSKIGTAQATRSIFVNDNNAKEYFTEVKGRKFNIPFFDKAMEGAEWKGSSGAIQKSDSMTQSFIDECNKLVKDALEHGGMSGLIRRHMLQDKLRNFEVGKV